MRKLTDEEKIWLQEKIAQNKGYKRRIGIEEPLIEHHAGCFLTFFNLPVFLIILVIFGQDRAIGLVLLLAMVLLDALWLLIRIGVLPIRCPKCHRLALRETGIAHEKAFGHIIRTFREYRCKSCGHTTEGVRGFSTCPRCGKPRAYGTTGRSRERIYYEHGCMYCDFSKWVDMRGD